jgi:hypothetical protein
MQSEPLPGRTRKDLPLPPAEDGPLKAAWTCVRDVLRHGSAPGGNRTLGLRLERPLLFDSPKRGVDH